MFLVAASAAVWTTNGQPFAACQTRFGAAIATATRTPAHGCQRQARGAAAWRGARARLRPGRARRCIWRETRRRRSPRPPATNVARRPFGPDDAHGDREPRQRLKSVGLNDDAPKGQRAAGEDDQAGEPAGVEAPAQHLSRRRGQRIRRRRGERWNEPEAPERMKRGVRPGGDQRHQRRLVGVSPCRMAPADDEIEFIAEIAV